MVSAGLAQMDCTVFDPILRGGRGSGIADILFLLEKLYEETNGEKENPKEKIDNPPPPADEQPPQETVAFLTIFCLSLCNGGTPLILLVYLNIHIVAAALGAFYARGLRGGPLDIVATVRTECCLCCYFVSALITIHNDYLFLLFV